MSTPSPARLGPYELIAPIGKGGMGEVWRARDPRLGRDVAIKISSQQFTHRFETEARAIAALNHPNICTLYDVGPDYLVMELVDGPTLAERIAQGPVPLDEALTIARQIAEALDAAHEKGIVHRDLKPANIKLRADGSVKVLDFGLAKPAAPQAALGDDSPTMLLSVAGVILGTAGYMSPEQARGKAADKRADIWAFGVVLYEMLTGKRLFDGETVSDALAAILTREPDLSAVPTKVRRLLQACLQKDPKRRLRDIGDWAELLEPAFGAATVRERSSLSKIAPWGVAGLLALVSAAVSFVHFREKPPEARVERFSLLTPEKADLSSVYSLPAISPDGRHVAITPRIDGQFALWVRDLDGLAFRMLPGTEGANLPFWSPDSRWIGFFAGRELKKIDVTGGPAFTLCDASRGAPRGGSWGLEDVIVFAQLGVGLFRVPAAGGAPEALTKVDTAAGEASHRVPWFLPDGRRFLYTARHNEEQNTRIYVDSIHTKPGINTRREVLAAASNAAYVPTSGRTGWLLFILNNTLMAQPFDGANAKTSGEAVPVAEKVEYIARQFQQDQFSASADGTLVYLSGASSSANKLLTWFDRSGKSVGAVGTPTNMEWAVLSLDGSAVAMDRREQFSGPRDIWLRNLSRSTETRLTFGPQSSLSPVWSPDGSRVTWFSGRDDNPHVKAANGTGNEETLNQDARRNRIDDWSRDGRYLIDEVVDPKTRNDIWVIPLSGDRKPFAWLNTEFNETNAKLSPNGQWLAYTSDESRRREVYVQTFPEHGGKWQISTNGSDWPVWSRDGRELYFISADNKMMAVEVKGSGAGFQAGVPKALFPVPAQEQYDVSKDGRFLIHVPVNQNATAVPITVVKNWQAGIKK